MFTRMIQQARRTPEQFTELAAELFRVMAAGPGTGQCRAGLTRAGRP